MKRIKANRHNRRSLRKFYTLDKKQLYYLRDGLYRDNPTPFMVKWDDYEDSFLIFWDTEPSDIGATFFTEFDGEFHCYETWEVFELPNLLTELLT